MPLLQATRLRAGHPLPRWLPVLLGFLQAVGPVSTDMYLPAFPAIEAAFHSPLGSAQITLGTWVLGLATGQLIQGALADRFGRRSPVLVGTTLYVIGALACALSGSMAQLAAWRFITAFGASASMVIPRAIVRDVAQGHAAASLMSQMTLILAAGPILAPSLGGLMLRFTSWRAIFGVTACYGLIALICAFWLPDTLPRAQRIPLHPISMLLRYGQILREKCFITHATMMSAYAFGLFAYLGGSPTIFIDLYHLSPGQYAMVFGACASSYILASQLNMRVVRRFDIDGTLTLMSWGYLAMATLLTFFAWRHVPVLLFVAALALTHSFNGFLVPTATVGALRHHGGRAGSASAVLGTMQYFIGAFGGFAVGLLANGTAIPMAGLMLGCALVAKTADLLRPPPP